MMEMAAGWLQGMVRGGLRLSGLLVDSSVR